MTVPYNDPCLFKDGTWDFANTTVNFDNRGSYYVPNSVYQAEKNKEGSSKCYGSYRFDGTYIDKVLS